MQYLHQYDLQNAKDVISKFYLTSSPASRFGDRETESLKNQGYALVFSIQLAF